MKTVEISLAGQVCHLLFNGAAMFAVDDAFGGSNELLTQISGTDKGSFASLCKAVVILAEQGELARRALGYDKTPILTEDTVAALIMPRDTFALKKAVLHTVTMGYGREIEDEDDVDLVLLELERKQGKG